EADDQEERHRSLRPTPPGRRLGGRQGKTRARQRGDADQARSRRPCAADRRQPRRRRGPHKEPRQQVPRLRHPGPPQRVVGAGSEVGQMAQAKGVLPRRDDREVLYKNPRTCGYFIGVKLDPTLDRARAEAWLGNASQLVDKLVTRLPAKNGEAKGEKVAAVAVGLAPSFFAVGGNARFDPPVEVPASFQRPLPTASAPLSQVPLLDADVLFYVASVFEARVFEFITKLAALRPEVAAVTLDRGYQRLDGTEPFGYRDGVRNIKTDDRPHFVFVHRDGAQLDEPPWADGGTYMAFVRILQLPDAFAALPDDAARDAVIGRTKDGVRLDLVGQSVEPRAEPTDEPVNLPPTAHVRKAGPRAQHDDVQIFRRGLP